MTGWVSGGPEGVPDHEEETMSLINPANGQPLDCAPGEILDVLPEDCERCAAARKKGGKCHECGKGDGTLLAPKPSHIHRVPPLGLNHSGLPSLHPVRDALCADCYAEAWAAAYPKTPCPV